VALRRRVTVDVQTFHAPRLRFHFRAARGRIIGGTPHPRQGQPQPDQIRPVVDAECLHGIFGPRGLDAPSTLDEDPYHIDLGLF
jgi:hypothetical protein